MACSAICTDKGTKRRVNQDACSVQVADTTVGEIIMAVICDGVGGLSSGELASSTVVHRFERWFQEELPSMLVDVSEKSGIDFDNIQSVWRLLLNKLNSAIQAYARIHNESLGTTFTGLFLIDGSFLIGHVGDCRVYLINSNSCVQITKDQTLLAEKLSAGEISPDEAASFSHRNVILQSVGTERVVRPTFYSGTYDQESLFLLCTDGAYRRAEQHGILSSFFEGVDLNNEASLLQASKDLLKFDMRQGETDNLTAVCISSVAASKEQNRIGMQTCESVAVDDAYSYGVSSGEDDLPTIVGAPASTADDVPTLVRQKGTGDDLPTMVGRDGV